MKKKFLAVIFGVILGTLFSTAVCFAAKNLGYAKYTNVVTYINHYPIQSHNFNGKTLIAAEDLGNFGFNVKWNEYKRCLTISRNPSITNVYEPYVTCPTKKQIGKNEFMVTTTDVKVYTGNYQYTSYGGVSGYTFIDVDELTCIDGVSVCWVPEVNAMKIWVDGLEVSSMMIRPIPMVNCYSIWDITNVTYYYDYYESPYIAWISVAGITNGEDYVYDPRGTLTIYNVIDANGDSILKSPISYTGTNFVAYKFDITGMVYTVTAPINSSKLYPKRAAENGGIIKFTYRDYDGYTLEGSIKVDQLPYGY